MRTSSSDSSGLSFRAATEHDVDLVVGLVNSSYRGESSKAGWTTEADLLGGQRTDAEEVLSLIGAEGSMLLLGLQGDEVVGTVHLQKEGRSAYLGMFAIRPSLQGAGIGKQFMQMAERIAQHEWGAETMVMTVITLRPELIAFYERRGYRRTGELKPFPTSPKFGIPKIPALQLEVLEKKLAAAASPEGAKSGFEEGADVGPPVEADGGE